MAKAGFLWRVTFLCNLCYLVSIYLRMHPSMNYGSFQSTLLVMGTLLAFVGNLLSIAVLLWLFGKGRTIPLSFRWLVIVNCLVFALQVGDLIF